MPPLVILRGAEPEWTVTDRVLAIAHVMAEDALCPGCGHARHESFNPDSEGYFTIKSAICQACAEVERETDRQSDSKEKGVKTWVVNDRPADVELRPWKP